MTCLLGIHIGHDATATLVDGTGAILASVAEERLSRKKFHTGFPFRAIEEVFRISQASKSDVSHVASSTRAILYPGFDAYNQALFSEEGAHKNDHTSTDKYRQLWELLTYNMGFRKGGSPHDFMASATQLTLDLQKEQLAKIGLGHAVFETVDHHHCHAASAYYCSGTEDPLIVTMDGAGDGLCATVSLIENGRIKRISCAESDCSPGRFYSEITRFLGYRRNRHEGKITGLAAFGDPQKYYPVLKAFMRFDAEKEGFTYPIAQGSGLKRKIKTVKRILRDENFGDPYIDTFYAALSNRFDPKADAEDLAAAAQLILEEAVTDYIQHFRARYPKSEILMAGGVFANVKVNQAVAELPGVSLVYIHQNMGDGGCAAGAAFSSLYENLKKPYTGYRQPHVYHGSSFSNDAIKAALEAERMACTFHHNIEDEIARLMADGKVVGRFNGGLEYGPRALGNRSLMASPADKSINTWLNKKLNRTEFMPFAPSILAEKAADVLVGYHKSNSAYASRFMTITYAVEPKWRERMQAAVHIDGTARPQVVRAKDNPSYHKIIQRFFERTGIPAIINTSFNMHEEPIVATPGDAIRAFRQGAMNYLAIGNYLCPAKALSSKTFTLPR